jgi:hypothetical protein
MHHFPLRIGEAVLVAVEVPTGTVVLEAYGLTGQTGGRDMPLSVPECR